jgi:NAD-dependent DNA ligase
MDINETIQHNEAVNSIQNMINNARKKEEKAEKPKRKYTLKVKPDATNQTEKAKKPKRKYTLKVKSDATNQTEKELTKPTRFNEKIIDMLEKMEKLMQQKGDNIRSRIYSRAQDTVLSYSDDIIDIKQLEGSPNIGPTIMSKMNEYIETGTLTVLEREKENPLTWLTEIHGIGPKKASELIKTGIRNIDELREKQDDLLNNVQKIGLFYYDDISKRIIRSEIDEYNKLFGKEFKKVADKDSSYEIVGSFRRGANTSGDIDVIITSKNADIFKHFIDSMKETGIIVETLSYGNTKCMVIAKLNADATARRVDFMYSPPEEYPFAILYFTGSKAFNTVMRGYALKLGISLNEHGMYKKPKGEAKGDKINNNFKTEEDIFKSLYLKYKSPEERIDGRSIETTLPIIDDSKTEKNSPECYNSCDTVPGGLCANGCTPSWTDKRLIGSRNWCHCNLDKTDCGARICSKEDTEAKTMKDEDNVSKKKRTTKKKKKSPSEKKETKQKTKKEKKIREPIEKKNQINNKPPEKENIQLDIEELPEIVPIITKTQIESEKKKISAPKNKTKKRKITLKEPVIINSEAPTEKMNKKNAIIQANEFKEKGITVLENMTEKELENVIQTTRDMYYNTKTPLVTDVEFDIIIEYVERIYPNNPILENIGAKVQKNKVKLPYEMASMDKIKPDTGALTKWSEKYKGPYVLSCKLDGVSGLYTTEGDSPKLYTRGDGKVGQDITHLLKVLKLPKEKDIVVRGEFIIPKKVFEEKYSKKFANARNLVSGIVNSKTIDEKVKDMDFVAYEVIKPELNPSEQMKYLGDLGHIPVKHQLEESLTNEQLSEILIDWRKNYDYEIDGVIVSDDKIHIRKSGNPDHAFAFKMVISDQVAEVKVVDVEWSPSKAGYLKPRVRIEPVKLGGVTIEYATGFNGKFIEENKIGIGAIIKIIRSGDVIPYIKSIIEPAVKPKMPDAKYHWTESHVDIILDDISGDATVLEKNITAFFTGLSVDGLSSGNVKRIIKAGYNSVPKILHMKKSDFEKVEGFKQKMIDKIHDGIKDKVASASLIDIMAASNLLGRGIGMRTIIPIMKKYPNILVSNESLDAKKDMLTQVDGIGKKNATSFVENIEKFMIFMREAELFDKVNDNMENVLNPTAENIEEVDTSHALYGKHIVMTKVRDKHIIEQLKKIGGILDNAMGKNTDILITKSYDDESNKTKKANEMKIPVLIPADFVKKYDL